MQISFNQSAQFIKSFATYTWFKNPMVYKAASIFNHAHIISMNLYQHAINQAFSSICSWDILDLKILQSDWPRPFQSISQKPDFSQIWDLCKNTANITNFPYRTNSTKKQCLNFPINSKNSNSGPFLVHFPYFWYKNIFFQKIPALSCITPHGPTTMLSFRKKTNMSIPRKHPDRRKDERMEGLTDPNS